MKPIEILIRAKDEASSVFGSLRSTAAAVGAAIAGYFGVRAFAGAVQGAADLEAKLSEVAAVSGASADDMVRLRDAAEQAGASTKYTATEAAEALGNLSRAGLSAQQAIEALPATLQLAQAGGVDLAQAAEFVTKAVQGMGLGFGEAGRVADVLAMGANASNTSVTGLAQALSYAAPTAKTLGLSLEDTVAIIGKFADAGIDASRAGTALNGILSQFADPASTFKRALSDIGITTTDFNKALAQLAAAGPRGQKAIAEVGLEAGPALKALLGQGIGALDDLRTKLQSAQGSAAATAATMSDNLNGSVKGLGSAWDTLKNALATPVLPVLKSGVDSLAASFRDAVSSGVVAKFGAAIATGFESAITWARAFAAQVDFAALGEAMRGYAAQAAQAFEDIKNAATTAGDVVRLVWGTMSAGTNAVLSGVYLVGGAFTSMAAQIQQGLALLYDGFSKVTFGRVSEDYARNAAAIRESANATKAATAALEQKAIDAFNAMADGAETARNGWTGLTAASSTTTSTMEGSVSPALANIAAELQAMGNKASEAGTKAAQSAAAQAQASADAKAKVAALRAEYEAAVATGNWQLAAEKIQALKTATDQASAGVSDLAALAADKAAAIAAAFAGMGIKTKTELADIANTAKTRFDLIKASGLATADGVAKAWKTMAEAAIAANDGVASETIKAEAAAHGLKVEVDATGKAIVTAMNAGRDATQGYTQSVNDSRTALERKNAALEREIAAQEKANDLKQRAIDLENKRIGRDREGFSIDKATGQRITQSVRTAADIEQELSQAGLSPAMAKSFAQRIAKAVDDETRTASGIGFSGGQGSSLSLNDRIAQAIKDGTSGGLAGTNTGTGGFSTAKTYNVTINGTTIRTSSDQDAKNLIAALKSAKLSS